MAEERTALTDKALARLHTLLLEAVPTPWSVLTSRHVFSAIMAPTGPVAMDVEEDRNAHLIVAAVNALSALLRAAERLPQVEAERDAYRAGHAEDNIKHSDQVRRLVRRAESAERDLAEAREQRGFWQGERWAMQPLLVEAVRERDEARAALVRLAEQHEAEADHHHNTEAATICDERLIAQAVGHHRRAAADLRAVLTELRRIATGELRHRYRTGLCPDEVEGHDSRDPLCAACKVLIRTDTALAGAAETGEPS